VSRGERLDGKEYDALLNEIDRKIDTSEPRRAEYWRGYRQGVTFRNRHRMGESLREHYILIETARNKHVDPYAGAHARGYRDGCEGKEPEESS
jgi:ribosome modulation factor